jgi:hypothetical protein
MKYSGKNNGGDKKKQSPKPAPKKPQSTMSSIANMFTTRIGSSKKK